jgi:hypothetical protein
MSTPGWRMKGQYFKNCNCIALCPCDTVGVPYPGPHCEGLNGMHVEEGHFGPIGLGGLTWAFTYHFPGALHEGNGTVQAFVDTRASEAQRQAILTILSGQAGGAWFEIVASLVARLLEPQFVPITFEFDRRGRRARLLLPLAEAVATPLTVPATGAPQRVIVRLPDGVEYQEIDVAQTAVLRSAGAIRFEHRGTNSNLADVEYSGAARGA